MMRKNILLCSALCAVAAGAPAYAESFTAEQAVRYALAHSPELRANEERVRAASARTGVAAGARLPEVGVRYLARRSNNPLDAFADKLNTRSVNPATDFAADALNQPDASTLHATELSLTWPLYTGGRVAAGVREAEGHESAARLGHTRAQQLTAFRTLTAYRHAQAVTEGLRIADDAVAAAQEHADTTARLLRQRRIVASDKLSADVNLALIQSQREQAASRRHNALNELKLVMDLALDAELTLAEWQEGGVVQLSEAVAVIEQRALEARPDLLAEQALLKASRERIDVARAANKPQISLVASESWYDDRLALDNNTWSVMGVVSANLYSGGRDSHRIAAARHQAGEAELRVEALRQRIRSEVREAYNAVTEAQARVAICADNIGKARQTVQLVRGRYGEGRTILIDMLQAERVLVEARNEKLAATLNRMVAEASLRLADGSIDLSR